MASEPNEQQTAFRPAWRLSDPQIVQHARAFWQRLDMLGTAEAERRVSELCAAAYSGDALVGVATAYIENLETLRARLAFFRCLVLPGARQNEIARGLAGLSRDLLERWSRETPGEQVLGMAAVIPAGAYKEVRDEPVWSEGGLNLNLVGYTRAGDQIRVSWFRHARLDLGAHANGPVH